MFLWRQCKEFPFVSAVLVGINLLVFILCLIFPNIYVKGACGIYEVFFQGEYGRLFWSLFLHSDAEHLFNNMIIVLFLGSMLEKEIGHISYGIIYFLSGLGGGVLSLLHKYLMGDLVVSIGASGAVFGLNGLLIAMVLLMKSRLKLSGTRVLVVVFLSLYSGFSVSNIDNAAHIGGLITGFLLGLLICIILRIKETKR